MQINIFYFSIRELEEERRQAALEEEQRKNDVADATYNVDTTPVDATYNVGQTAMGQTFDLLSTPLRNVNQLPSDTYELTPHGSDKVITLGQ